MIGNRQAADEASRIRALSVTTRADMSQIVAYAFNGADNPVAVALDVDSTDVVMRQAASGWCAGVTVRRFLAERRLFLTVGNDGTMQPVERCRV